VDKVLASIHNVFADRPLMPLSEFLDDPDDIAVPQCDGAQLEEVETSTFDNKVFCAEKGLPHPVPVDLSSWPRSVLDRLPASQLELLKIQMFRLGVDPETGVDAKGNHIFLELTQSIKRAPVGINIVPCILPKGKIVDLKNKTILSGEFGFALTVNEVKCQ